MCIHCLYTLLRKYCRDDFADEGILIEGRILHFADGSQEASSSIDASVFHRLLQRSENIVLVLTDAPISKESQCHGELSFLLITSSLNSPGFCLDVERRLMKN